MAAMHSVIFACFVRPTPNVTVTSQFGELFVPSSGCSKEQRMHKTKSSNVSDKLSMSRLHMIDYKMKQ